MKTKIAKTCNKKSRQTESESVIVVQRPSPVVEPPYSCKIMWVKGVVRVVVNLQRCSDKCINFTPTAERFYLDTFKHSKKYKLDFVYPHAVRVDASAPEATLEAGILKTDLKIVDWADAASQHAEILSIHGGMLKARGIKGVDENGEKKEGPKCKSFQSNATQKQSGTPRQVIESSELTKLAQTQCPNKKRKKNTPASVTVEQPQRSKQAQPKKKKSPGKVEPPAMAEANSEPTPQKPKKKEEIYGKVRNERNARRNCQGSRK